MITLILIAAALAGARLVLRSVRGLPRRNEDMSWF
jgi:hypothetical protein